MIYSTIPHPIPYVVQKIGVHLMYPSRYGIPIRQLTVQRVCAPFLTNLSIDNVIIFIQCYLCIPLAHKHKGIYEVCKHVH